MNIFNSLTAFLKELSNYVTFDYLVYGSLGLTLLVLVSSIIRTNFTYEVKLLRNVTKLNRYFAKNPYVNDENIVELNERMKNVPKTLRYCWQEYMLNRDKAPSEYMNTITCVDQPSKTSAYANTATSVGTFSIIIAVITLLLGLARMSNDTEIRLNPFFFEVFLLPIMVVALGFLFVAFLRARHTSIIADLYFTFHEFERNMNKACTTMPAFIDYEVLFTRKEIKEGIPVLQDYLEKRAIEEKREREEAELNASKFEYYDFDELGVDNALLLERAMKECEKYINVKRDLTVKVQSKETEMFNYQKNFDEVTKDFERKAQASRETIAQLTDQINQTTVKIEANYMKKRLNEEQTRLQQLEKDYELATSRFQKQQDEMQAEVTAFNNEIAKRRATTEDAMKAECKNYANKIYGQISKTVQEQSKPYIDQINEDKANLEQTISELKTNLANKTDELAKTSSELSTKTEEYQIKVAELKSIKELKTYLTSPEFKQSFLSRKEIKELKDGRQVEISEDVVKQIADLEDRVRLAEHNSILYQDKITLLERNLEAAEKEVEQAKKLNTELFEKAKTAKANEQKAVELTTVKPEKVGLNFGGALDKLEAKENSAKPAGAAPRVPRKKASLNSLLDAVNKMQNDSLSSKTVSSKARTNKPVRPATEEE